MSNFNIQGFGGIRFAYGDYTATFSYSFGQVSYEPEFDRITNANRKIYSRFAGFRPTVECRLISAEDDMYIQVQNLINIINSSLAANAGITIYPEYSSTNNNNLTLTGMLYNSDFKLEDIVKREGIQGLSLEFIADELIDSIPLFANSGIYLWVDESDNQFVDESGNTFIFE